MQEDGKKLRILCLHGYRQNEVTFREKLGAFRKLVKGKRVDLVFFSSPVKVPPSSDDEAGFRVPFNLFCLSLVAYYG